MTPIDKLPAVQLINPWSGAMPPQYDWTWMQVRKWAAEHIHRNGRKDWLKSARKAFRAEDGETLGSMIIGS